MGSESSSRTINLNGRSNKLHPNSNGGKKKSQENIIDRGKRAGTNSSSKKTKTNRDNSLQKLLFKDGGLPDGTVVTYYNKKHKGEKVLGGKKMGKGIICDHCNENISASKFEEHAKFGSRRQPYMYIFTPQMVSLNDLYISLLNEKIACVLCRGYDFCESYFGPQTVMICDQCEREYHVGCLKEHKMEDLKELPEGNWFCCEDCESVYTSLHNLVDSGEKPLENSFAAEDYFDVGWRLLNGKEASLETKSLLSEAQTIFKDCFKPIIDPETGADFIPSMVYGNTINGQNFKGMYCAMLTIKDSSGMSKVVSAGILRVFGREIAELPLVATRKDYQHKGYFKVLFGCIEKLLASLDVKNLVLPATNEAQSVWTGKFGFQKMPEENVSEYNKVRWQIMAFNGTSMLEKSVPKFL